VDSYGLFTTLVRWGGMLAVLYAALSIFGDLLALFFIFSEASTAGFVFRDMLTQYSQRYP